MVGIRKGHNRDPEEALLDPEVKISGLGDDATR